MDGQRLNHQHLSYYQYQSLGHSPYPLSPSTNLSIQMGNEWVPQKNNEHDHQILVLNRKLSRQVHPRRHTTDKQTEDVFHLLLYYFLSTVFQDVMLQHYNQEISAWNLHHQQNNHLNFHLSFVCPFQWQH